MGGLIVQKLLERGVGRAGVLVTPASPGDCRGPRVPAQAVTFANILFSGDVGAKSHKIWRWGFSWGVLNRVPRAKHPGIYAGTVHDSGGVYNDIAYPERDPERSAFVDEAKITAPILTLGGARDRAVPIGDVRLLAEKYSRVGGDYLEYPDHGHWIVDEPGTDQVISDIETWLAAKGLTPTAPPVKATAKAKAAPAARPAPAAKPVAAEKTVAKAPAAKPKAATKTVAKPTPAPAAVSCAEGQTCHEGQGGYPSGQGRGQASEVSQGSAPRQTRDSEIRPRQGYGQGKACGKGAFESESACSQGEINVESE